MFILVTGGASSGKSAFAEGLIEKSGKKKKIYIVEILLPKGLITSYNKELPYLLEMEGKAEIITDDLSLLERFLLPIKKVLKENL